MIYLIRNKEQFDQFITQERTERCNLKALDGIESNLDSWDLPLAIISDVVGEAKIYIVLESVTLRSILDDLVCG